MLLISVVTIVFNNHRVIEATLISVLEQDYPLVEHIVVDGGSTDGTVEIIRKYADLLSYWISEPDKGIYDAMNKGIKQSSGDWIIFMNAGDRFYNKTVLSEVFLQKNYEASVIYGCAVYRYDQGYVLRRPQKLDHFNQALPFCHQAAFIRGDLMRKTLYDTRYRLTADYVFFYGLYQKHHEFSYVHQIIAIYDGQGTSANSKYRREMVRERAILHNQNFSVLWIRSETRRLYRCILKAIIPKKIVNIISGRGNALELKTIEEITL